MTELFFRHGTKFEGKPIPQGKGFVTVVTTRCTRCGGAGGGEQWRHTGWTCFQCGGNGNGPTKTERLFTAEKLAKLNATAAKKAAKKAAEFEAAHAAEEAAANARREAFLAEHGKLIERAEAFAERNPFIKDVARKARERAEITERQEAALVAAIAKIEAEEARKAVAEHVGKIGERITLTVVAERVTTIETQFGLMRIAAMRTPEGHAIVTKGRFIPPTANFNRETDRWEIGTEAFTIRGTVKEHGEFRGEKNTILARAMVVE